MEFKQIWRLAEKGAHRYLRKFLPTWVTDFEGQRQARLYGILSATFVCTAKRKEDLKKAFRYAQRCRATAEPGSNVANWALQKLAGVCVNLARFDEAKEYAEQFLEAAAHDSTLAPYVPMAVRDIFHVHCARDEYELAIQRGLEALDGFRAQGNEMEVLRTACNLVWAYMMAGQLEAARAVLPVAVPKELKALRLGAQCALSYAEGNLEEAKRYGKAALKLWRTLYDSLDASEVARLLAQIAELEGDTKAANASRQEEVAFAAKQGVALIALLSARASNEGGEQQNEAVARPSGERCGASFTTSVGSVTTKIFSPPPRAQAPGLFLFAA